MLLGEQVGCHLRVGLAHGVFVHHASDVTSVAGDALLAHIVSGSRNPVNRMLAQVAVDILIHFGASWQVNEALHALLQGNTSKVVLVAPRLIDLVIDSACSLSEEVILQGDTASIAR